MPRLAISEVLSVFNGSRQSLCRANFRESCSIEGKDGSTRYYAPIAFTREEIERIRYTGVIEENEE